MNSQTILTATVTVRVPLGARGDLADGARRIVERLDGVDRLESATVRDISPGLNDTTVELHAELAVDPDGGESRFRDEVAGTTGVVGVDPVEHTATPIETDVG